MSFNIGAVILGFTEKLAFSDNKRMEVAALRQRAAASGDATAVQKAKRNVRLMISHMTRKAKSTGASFGDVFVKMKSDHVQWQRGRHGSRPVLDWTNAAKVQAAKDKGQAVMKARQAADAVTAASTAKTVAADVAANKNIRRAGGALLGATALAGGAAALYNHRRDRQQMKTAGEKLAISDELARRANNRRNNATLAAEKLDPYTWMKANWKSSRSNELFEKRLNRLHAQKLKNSAAALHESFAQDEDKLHRISRSFVKKPSVSAAAQAHTAPAAAAAKARGFRGPSLKQIGIGSAVLAAGTGAALYARRKRKQEKTAGEKLAISNELAKRVGGMRLDQYLKGVPGAKRKFDRNSSFQLKRVKRLMNSANQSLNSANQSLDRQQAHVDTLKQLAKSNPLDGLFKKASTQMSLGEILLLKTAAIPAARFKELRGQIAGRLAHRADMVSNRLLDAHGADLLRLRAQKRRLGGMLGRAQQHEVKYGLRGAGVNTNVRNSAAALSAERSAVTGSTANAATKITRRPAPPAGGGMANDATKVVKTPPLPAATGGADHTRTGLGWHLQKPKVRAA